VLDDGPADEAGLQEGDIITRIGVHSLLEPLDAEVEEDFDLDESLPVQRLLSIARGLEPGEDVEIEYLRDGERLTATVEARELSLRTYAQAYGARGCAQTRSGSAGECAGCGISSSPSSHRMRRERPACASSAVTRLGS
jgi:C-terminal processing protease CtpA/Prc